MIIYAMTATFGKLEHQTLTLEPGLNIIEAPNEWGKSTWCAFLTAMLYGLDTRAKSTKNALADKERYAPWSGSPMSGRIDLNWQGRDITIERTTRGRIPLGSFRAYETATGLEIKALTAANCGQQLLGVERSVFLRSGFLRLNDLPVTEDEALRRRLHALVSTGDESGRGEKLGLQLKELKNRIRYNRTGLLPQAQAKEAELTGTLQELQQLRQSSEEARNRLEQVADWQLLLENHQTALAYAQARSDAAQVEQARTAMDRAGESLAHAEAACESLPDRQTTRDVLDRLRRLERSQRETEDQLLALERPQPMNLQTPFTGMGGDEAVFRAIADRNTHWELSRKKPWLFLLGVLLALAGGTAARWHHLPGVLCCILGLVLLAVAWGLKARRGRVLRDLERRYGYPDPELWIREAELYAAQLSQYQHRQSAADAQDRELRKQLDQLHTAIQKATEGLGLEACSGEWTDVLKAWDAADRARNAWEQAQSHYQALRAMAKPAAKPQFPDRMEYSQEETSRLLADCQAEAQRLTLLLGQYQGRMDAIGSQAALEQELQSVQEKISQLEQTYKALRLAQTTLEEASAQLQRRFAPPITQGAQALMERLTAGRYDRLQLMEDLRLQAGAEQEDVLRESLWRSDGTMDQLYLSLRLAVARELIPDAPLILDDCLVRFDDVRLKAALEILKELGENCQILLFTCQSREKRLM